MIFVETSAIVAMLLKEPERVRLSEALQKAKTCITGAHVRLEANMVVSSRLGILPSEANIKFDVLLQDASITVAPFTDEIAEAAVIAFEKYGKGRNAKTSLNLADCMSYAFAKSLNLKILYTGTDFKGTDLKAA